MASPSDEVVGFWREAGPKRWFRRDYVFDDELRRRFEATYLEASRGQLQWGGTAKGALALLLLLDQFPRNMYRGTAQAFATDPLARLTARDALAEDQDLQVDFELQPFFYLPLEHDETAASQAESCRRMQAYVDRGGDESYLRYAALHSDLISRFGRFPHRNAALGRPSTPEELAYLRGGGFKG